MSSTSALSAGVHTTTLIVMVDRVKGGGRAPPPSPGWAEFTIMMDARQNVTIPTLCVLCGSYEPKLYFSAEKVPFQCTHNFLGFWSWTTNEYT